MNELPVDYKHLTEESKKRFPDIWESIAFKLGALWMIEKIYKNLNKKDIIEKMNIPTITCD